MIGEVGRGRENPPATRLEYTLQAKTSQFPLSIPFNADILDVTYAAQCFDGRSINLQSLFDFMKVIKQLEILPRN